MYIAFKRFDIKNRNLVDDICNNGNPHMVVGPDNKKIMTPPDDGVSTPLTTPFIRCNDRLNRWQMYFSFSDKDSSSNNVYTAFLNKGCDKPPVL